MAKAYDLTDSQILQIARLCVQEQGSFDGVKAEASIMANLFEKQSKYDSLYDYVRHGGWFSRAAYWMDNGSASDASDRLSETFYAMATGHCLPTLMNTTVWAIS